MPTKMEQTGCSETSTYKIQTPGNYPEESLQQSEHVGSLKSRINVLDVPVCFFTNRSRKVQRQKATTGGDLVKAETYLLVTSTNQFVLQSDITSVLMGLHGLCPRGMNWLTALLLPPDHTSNVFKPKYDGNRIRQLF